MLFSYCLCTNVLEPIKSILQDKTSAPYDLRGCSVCHSLPTTFHLTYFERSLVFSTSMAMSPLNVRLPQTTDPWFVLKWLTIFFSLTSRQLEYTAYYYHVNFLFSTSIVNSLHTTKCDIADISVTLLTFLMIVPACIKEHSPISWPVTYQVP